MRVLVIEDEHTLQGQLVKALTAQGYAVDTADKGEDGH